MTFVLVYFRALKRKPVICKSDNAFQFSCFLVPSWQRNRRKSFSCHGKYFAKQNFCAPTWTSTKCYCVNKKGKPERAVSLHLACSGCQSQHGIWFILPARRACHIRWHFELLFCPHAVLISCQPETVQLRHLRLYTN